MLVLDTRRKCTTCCCCYTRQSWHWLPIANQLQQTVRNVLASHTTTTAARQPVHRHAGAAIGPRLLSTCLWLAPNNTCRIQVARQTDTGHLQWTAGNCTGWGCKCTPSVTARSRNGCALLHTTKKHAETPQVSTLLDICVGTPRLSQHALERSKERA